MAMNIVVCPSTLTAPLHSFVARRPSFGEDFEIVPSYGFPIRKNKHSVGGKMVVAPPSEKVDFIKFRILIKSE
jgi:hypothetical protein